MLYTTDSPTDSPTKKIEIPVGWQAQTLEIDGSTVTVLIPPPQQHQQWLARAGRAALQAVNQKDNQDGH